MMSSVDKKTNITEEAKQCTDAAMAHLPTETNCLITNNRLDKDLQYCHVLARATTATMVCSVNLIGLHADMRYLYNQAQQTRRCVGHAASHPQPRYSLQCYQA
jgi:hypothetical protein